MDDIHHYFEHNPYRIHRNEPMVYALGGMILKELGHSDILSAPLKKRDLDKFLVETSFFIAKRLALFMVVPQRYSQARNMIAASVNAFSARIARFRSGHGMLHKKKRMLCKELIHFLDELIDDGYLWTLADGSKSHILKD